MYKVLRRWITAASATIAVTAALAPAVANAATGGTVGNFAYGEMQATTVGQSGCGTNQAGEPSIHVSKDNLVGLGSENGLGGGSVYWTGSQLGGTSAAS